MLLPGTVLVLIPALLLGAANGSGSPAFFGRGDRVETGIAVGLILLGLLLATWTVRLFVHRGDETPGPWDPPRRLVVLGPYRHVRNPMITSVLVILLGETLFFRSLPIALWTSLFFLGNTVYFPLFEERGLESRFGDEYRRYKANVPRWVPRLRPWAGAPGDIGVE